MHLKSVSINTAAFPSDTLYPFSLPVIRKTAYLDLDRPVTIFAGENGSGKSTLLEALGQACGIHIWQFSGPARVASNPFEDKLSRYLEPEWEDRPLPGSFFSSKTFQDFTKLVEEWASSDPGQLDYYGGHSLMTQSHGQSLMSFFRNRYKIPGVYFLDEPETALSPRSQLELLEIISDMGRAGHAQFILATHSPILMSCPEAVICSFDTVPVSTVGYRETSHFKIYREFFS
jgi:predicted ATPase